MNKMQELPWDNPRFRNWVAVARAFHSVERAMGGLLVVTGVLFLTGNFTRLSYWFLETFPVLASFG